MLLRQPQCAKQAVVLPFSRDIDHLRFLQLAVEGDVRLWYELRECSEKIKHKDHHLERVRLKNVIHLHAEMSASYSLVASLNTQRMPLAGLRTGIDAPAVEHSISLRMHG